MVLKQVRLKPMPDGPILFHDLKVVAKCVYEQTKLKKLRNEGIRNNECQLQDFSIATIFNPHGLQLPRPSIATTFRSWGTKNYNKPALAKTLPYLISYSSQPEGRGKVCTNKLIVDS